MKSNKIIKRERDIINTINGACSVLRVDGHEFKISELNSEGESIRVVGISVYSRIYNIIIYLTDSSCKISASNGNYTCFSVTCFDDEIVANMFTDFMRTLSPKFRSERREFLKTKKPVT